MTTSQLKQQNIFSLFKIAVQGKHQNFTRGPIGIAAFLLAVPMVLEMLMESVFAITDIFFVSALGAEAVAVVGLTEAVLTLLYAIAVGISMAVTATIARRIGEKNTNAANTAAAQTLWIGMFVSLLVAFAGYFFALDILKLMGATETMAKMGENYTQIMLMGSITILYLFLLNAIFRGAGDAAIAMRSLWLANGINIVLDPLLIYGVGPFPEMGLTGAAVATTIGRGVGVLYQLYHLFNVGNKIRLAWHNINIDWTVVKKLLNTSLGGVFQFLIATASWILLVRIVASYGSEAVAGYTIAIRVIMFTILPAWGLSNAVATLVGQNLGAGKAKRAERSVWKIAQYNVVFMLIVAVAFFFFAESIIGLFSQQPNVIATGADCLRFISYGYGFFALGMILIQAFNGAGDTMTPTKVNFLCYWIIQVPLAYALAKFAGLETAGVFIAISVSQAIVALFGYYMFQQGKWKLKQV